MELDRGARRLSALREREISCQTRLDDALGSGLYDELVQQLALVYRLAVGRALAGSERLLVVIDDPRGNTDEARQTRALELLQDSARQLQIVVLTCRPERYAGLAGVARFELP